MITREELYALVWSGPGKNTAARLQVSGSYLRRVCRALDVPCPPPGWWRRREFNKAPPPPPLPPARPGFPDRWATARNGGPPIKQLVRIARSASEVPEDGRHPLVRVASQVFGRSPKSEDGTHLVPRSIDAIDLTCSAAALDPALELADALLRAFEARGHWVRISTAQGLTRPPIDNRTGPGRAGTTSVKLWCPLAPTVAFVGVVPIGLAVLETTEDVLMRYVGHGHFEPAATAGAIHGLTWDELRRRPTGRLKVVAFSPHHPAPWQREWHVPRAGARKRTAAIVAELEDAVTTLPHAPFFLNGG